MGTTDNFDINLLQTTQIHIATLSFCITCKNRLWQIRETLPKNLMDNIQNKDKIEFILVDFASDDGLQQWVLDNFVKEIEEGYLKYFFTKQLPYWHVSIAKNTSHILAKNNILVNLDCDNYTGYNGGLFVIENMLKYGINNTVIHQFNNNYGSGSYGRIALTKYNFMEIGGYDESFEPMVHEDTDLLKRLFVNGMKYIHLIDNEYNKSIPNKRADSMTNVNSDLTWEEMKEKNFQKSFKNITSGKIKANTEKGYIGITDNIYRLQ